MKKRNVMIHTAIASALLVMMGAANAATAISATSVKYATEQFAGTTPYAAISGKTFSVISSTAIPVGSILTVQVELTGAVIAVTPVGAAPGAIVADNVQLAAGLVVPTVTVGSTTAGVTTAAAGVVAPTTTASNANVYNITFTTDTAIGIGGTIVTIGIPSLNAAGLAASGATVTANASVFVGTQAAPVGAAVSTTGLLEAVSGATTLATTAKGITLTGAASTATAKIDLTATVPSTKFTATTASATETGSTTKIRLGSLTVTDGTSKVVAAGNAAYVTGAKTTVATLTAPAGFFAPLGTTGIVELVTIGGNACSGAVVGTSATFATAPLAAAATSLSLPASALTGAVAPGTAWDVCMTVNGTTPIVLGTPTLTATLGAAAAQDSVDTLASTNMLALTSNGQTVDVRSYIPAATVGYTSFVRVINTGTLAAGITGQWLYENGTSGTAATLISTLPAGGSSTLSATQIEAAVGAPTAIGTDRPRLRLTAPTNGLQAQSFFLTNANGNFSDATGAQ